MEGEESEEKNYLFSKSSRANSAVPDEKIEVLSVATTINDPDAISFSSMPITMNASMQSLRSSMQSLRSSRQSFHSPRQSLRSPRQSLFSPRQSLHLSVQSLKTVYSVESQKNEEQDQLDKAQKVALKRKEKILCRLQYVLFSLLSMVCAFTVMIIWYSVYQENKTMDIGAQNQTDLRVASDNACPVWEITGDGYCDDEANVAECGFDFKDCCQLTYDRTACQDCFCHYPEVDKASILDKYLQSQGDYAWLFTNWGNGKCDLNHNNAEHFFDHGDCCLESLTCQLKFQNATDFVPQYCPDEPCILSNMFCVQEELGDGKCQDHNNSPFCDYDLGDCCSDKQRTECRNCACGGVIVGDVHYPNPYTPYGV